MAIFHSSRKENMWFLHIDWKFIWFFFFAKRNFSSDIGRLLTSDILILLRDWIFVSCKRRDIPNVEIKANCSFYPNFAFIDPKKVNFTLQNNGRPTKGSNFPRQHKPMNALMNIYTHTNWMISKVVESMNEWKREWAWIQYVNIKSQIVS